MKKMKNHIQLENGNTNLNKAKNKPLTFVVKNQQPPFNVAHLSDWGKLATTEEAKNLVYPQPNA